jgi:transmembrane sensor
MSAPRQTPDEIRRLDREAAAWLVKRDRGLTAEEQDAFFQWLAADPRHGEWFARHRRTWKEFNLLAEWKPEHSIEPNPDLLAGLPRKITKRFRRTGMIALAAAASLLAGVMLWEQRDWPRSGQGDPVPLRLAAGEYERRVLEDGSVVELNRGARLEIAYAAAERRVYLLEGEAGFTVAKNPARPFIVRAAGVDVRAVGTAFNISLGSHHVEVLVTEGRVRVDDALRGESVLAPTITGERPVLTAGQKITVGVVPAAPVAVTQVSSAEVTRLLAWRPDLLEFDSTPLAAVVESFNRRNTVQLVIADDTLRDLPIVASFRADNVDGFVRLLELTAGVRVERRNDVIVLRVSR